MTKLQILNDAYGANFTYGTLAAIIKYPWESSSRKAIERKKFGYFKSEEEIVKRIQENTGLSEGVRHPATYLLEAADDIIYICDDIEDGVKKGYIPWDSVYKDIKKRFEDEKYQKLYGQIESRTPDGAIDDADKILSKVRMFRNYTQGYLFERAINEFMDNYDSIMTGTYDKKELLKCEEEFVAY